MTTQERQPREHGQHVQNVARSIALVGLSATGKSTIARIIATRLGWFWFDTDAIIVERASRSIAQLFGNEGEAYFRKLETETLREVLLTPQPGIIATGGGVVLSEENRTLLHAHAYVVWLDAPTEVLLNRLAQHEEPRPLLAGEDPHARLEALRAARSNLYQEVANQKINTAAMSPEQVAASVLESCQQQRWVLLSEALERAKRSDALGEDKL
jgi:shikimate kinase